MQKTEVLRTLERLGEALSSADMKAAAACWGVPALFLSDELAMGFMDPAEIEKTMGQAAQGYRARGIASTKPEIERIEALTDSLAAIDVRWPSLDASGKEVASERSYYILRLGEDGLPQIRVALTRTK